MQLASLLSSELGAALPSTVAFDYPTVDAITRFVLMSPSEVTAPTMSVRVLNNTGLDHCKVTLPAAFLVPSTTKRDIL